MSADHVESEEQAPEVPSEPSSDDGSELARRSAWLAGERESPEPRDGEGDYDEIRSQTALLAELRASFADLREQLAEREREAELHRERSAELEAVGAENANRIEALEAELAARDAASAHHESETDPGDGAAEARAVAACEDAADGEAVHAGDGREDSEARAADGPGCQADETGEADASDEEAAGAASASEGGELESERATRDEPIAELQGAPDEGRREVLARCRGLERALEEEIGRTARSEESCAALRIELAVLQSTADARLEELSSEQLGLAETRAELAGRDEELTVLRKQLGVRDQELTALRKQLEVRDQQVSLFESECAALRQSLERAAVEAARENEARQQLLDALGAVGELAARQRPDEIRPTAAEPAQEKLGRPTGGDQQPVFRFWRDRELAAALADLGIGSFDDFLVHHLQAVARDGEPLRVVCVAGGDPDLELRLCQRLLAEGIARPRIQRLDASDGAREALAREAAARGLEGAVTTISPRDWDPEAGCDALIADGALTASREPERLLDLLRRACEHGAPLLLADRIGAPPRAVPHATREAMERVWEVMSERYRENLVTNALDEAFPGGVSESVAAGCADSLWPWLRERFHVELAVGFGHLADLFVGPERGAHFDLAQPADRDFVELFREIDASRMSEDGLAPLHCVAVLRAVPVESPRIIGLGGA